MLSFANAHATADPSWGMQTSGTVDTFPMGNVYSSRGFNLDVGPFQVKEYLRISPARLTSLVSLVLSSSAQYTLQHAQNMKSTHGED